MQEISGDVPLSTRQKLRYLWSNLQRNMAAGSHEPAMRRFLRGRPQQAHPAASPGRALTEAFLQNELPRLLPPTEDRRILEIGCGSGRLSRQLAAIGYRGSYLGLDVQDRFDHAAVPGMMRRFIQADAHDFDSDEKYDLIVSVSALEHIPEDDRLIARLPGMLRPGGLQLHFVPSGWGLFVYLWHGYRQYSLPAIGSRFAADGTCVYALGGVFSFLLHICVITLGETVLRLPLRRHFSGLYSRLLDAALWLDRGLPFCPSMFAVIQGKPAPQS